jgi:hypothetical protein
MLRGVGGPHDSAQDVTGIVDISVLFFSKQFLGQIVAET